MPHVTPQLLWNLDRVGAAVSSGDGSRIVVPVTSYDIDENKAITRIVDVTDGRVLTSETNSASSPALSHDGSLLAFVRKVEDIAQIHVMPMSGGEPGVVTDVPLAASAPKFMPDGSGIVFLSMVYRHARDAEAAAAHKEELAESKVTARVTEDRMYRFWDRWLTDGEIPHLCHVDLSNGEVIDLMPDETAWWVWDNTSSPGSMFDIAPDSSGVAYSAIPYSPEEPPTSAVFTLEIGAATPVLISGDHHGNCSRPRYSPDGDKLIYGRQERHDFYADRQRLVLVDLASGAHTVLTEDWDRSASGWEFHGHERLVFTAEHDAGAGVYTMPLYDPDPVEIGSGGTASGVCVAADQIYVTVDSLTAPAELHRVDASGYQQVTHVNDDLLADVEICPVEDMRFPGAGDAEIQMFVIYPPEFDTSRQWPLVHLIHGGPHGVFGDQWHHRWNAQAIASQGYVVAHVNFHGSTSWGQAFAESIEGAWGERPYEDVVKATDCLVAKGFIDPDRMGITGGSYGGYLTAWITSQTDRFACAIAHAAVTNLGGMHASDVVFHRATAYGAEYWVDHERVDRWSPSVHSAGYSTPTLVIHGEKDYRVPVTQGLELYGMLKAKGVEARLVYYPDENHWILSPQNSIHWYGEFLGWLDRHLGGEP